MTDISTIMRILLGIALRSTEMMTLEAVSTAVRARHITAAVSILTVTASAEQMPRIWMVIGLLSERGSRMICLVFAMCSSCPGWC